MSFPLTLRKEENYRAAVRAIIDLANTNIPSPAQVRVESIGSNSGSVTVPVSTLSSMFGMRVFEVTPEMVNAGVEVLRSRLRDIVLTEPRIDAIDSMVIDILHKAGSIYNAS